MPKVSKAKEIFSTLPQSGALLLPPIIQRIATGNKDRPIIVMTHPVTTGGKKRIIFEK